MTPSTKEMLIAAREVIALPEHWTKRTDARDKFGDPVSFNNPDATCFCVGAALRKVCPFELIEYCKDALNTAAREFHVAAKVRSRFPSTYIRLNDHIATTHQMVLAMFDKAIELAGES